MKIKYLHYHPLWPVSAVMTCCCLCLQNVQMASQVLLGKLCRLEGSGEKFLLNSSFNKT